MSAERRELLAIVTRNGRDDTKTQSLCHALLAAAKASRCACGKYHLARKET